METHKKKRRFQSGNKKCKTISRQHYGDKTNDSVRSKTYIINSFNAYTEEE